MPSVFLCHASEDKPIVEPIQLALASAGCQVFYDEQSLPPGGDYQARIHAAIMKCDVFVFVASPASLAEGKFTLTELKFARDRWASPVNRVLPVVLSGLKPSDLPQYLRAATVLIVRGNAAAEVRATVETMLRALKRPRRLAVTLAVGGAALTLSLTVTRFTGPTHPTKPSLPAPVPQEPPCGTTIPWPPEDHFFILSWASVGGASTYTVEADCFGCSKRDWYSLSGTPWHVRSGLGLRTPIYSSKIHVQLRNAGGMALRWRVWAVDPDGQEGEKSRWCQVAFAGR